VRSVSASRRISIAGAAAVRVPAGSGRTVVDSGVGGHLIATGGAGGAGIGGDAGEGGTTTFAQTSTATPGAAGTGGGPLVLGTGLRLFPEGGGAHRLELRRSPSAAFTPSKSRGRRGSHRLELLHSSAAPGGECVAHYRVDRP